MLTSSVLNRMSGECGNIVETIVYCTADREKNKVFNDGKSESLSQEI